MRVFFLSDIHLRDGHGPQAAKLTSFFKEIPASGDVVLLGGDIFDLLVGAKKVFRRRFEPVLTAMEYAANRGVEIHYLEGNHDFHFSKMFEGTANIHVHQQDYSLIAHNRRILVSHGDLIDGTDYGYRFLRFITKNYLFEIFVWVMPDFLVDIIGRSSARKSRDYTRRIGTDLKLERVRSVYMEFARKNIRLGFDHVLVGHSHLADQISIKDGPYTGEYLNLGFAADHLAYAVLGRGEDHFSVQKGE